MKHLTEPSQSLTQDASPRNNPNGSRKSSVSSRKSSNYGNSRKSSVVSNNGSLRKKTDHKRKKIRTSFESSRRSSGSSRRTPGSSRKSSVAKQSRYSYGSSRRGSISSIGSSLLKDIYGPPRSPYGSRRASMEIIVRNKWKEYMKRERALMEKNIPLQKRKVSSVCSVSSCHSKPSSQSQLSQRSSRKSFKNRCVIERNKLRNACNCKACGPRKPPRMMYLIKRGIFGRLYGANMRELTDYIQKAYPNAYDNKDLAVQLQRSLSRMFSLGYIKRNPTDPSRYVLTSTGRVLKLAEANKKQNEEKIKRKHRRRNNPSHYRA